MWVKRLVKSRTCQLAAELTTTFQKTEVNHHSSSAGITYGQNDKSPVFGCLKFLMILADHRSHMVFNHITTRNRTKDISFNKISSIVPLNHVVMEPGSSFSAHITSLLEAVPPVNKGLSSSNLFSDVLEIFFRQVYYPLRF